MTKINLLPWREERHQELKQEFFIQLAGCAAFAALTLLAAHLLYNERIENQQRNNQDLQQEIAKLDERIQVINNLQTERQQLQARVNVIEKLQRNRPSVVRMFDDLVKVVPDGLYYLALVRKDNLLTMEGRADSNSSVSKLMRNIELSSSLTEPHLAVIKAEADNSNYFNLQVKIANDVANDKSGDPAGVISIKQ